MTTPQVLNNNGQVYKDDPHSSGHEDGFMLLAVVVMVALLLISLSVAATVVARELRRDKEVESQHRAQQYVRAVRLYYRKFGQYPPSIQALENSNNIRFLRHQYVDPLTGKADYKLIHQGEQKTKIHVFFGKELDGLAAGLGSAAGLQSSSTMNSTSGVGGNNGMTTGTTSVTATNALNSGFGGATTSGTATSGSSGANGTPAPAVTSGSGMFGDGTGGVIVGVGTTKTGPSVTEPNGQKTYETWEFWYDPRIEMLKRGVIVTGGGVGSQSANSFGQNGETGQPDSGSTGPMGTSGSAGTNSSTPPLSNPF
jgi:type II secretory pathway pseudopilin PulG